MQHANGSQNYELVRPTGEPVLAGYDLELMKSIQSFLNLTYDPTKRLSEKDIRESYVEFEDVPVHVPSHGGEDGQDNDGA
jgi:hypothetical protein